MRFLKTALLAGLAFGGIFGVALGVVALLITRAFPVALVALAVGTAGGVPFGLLLASFQESVRRNAALPAAVSSGERVLHGGVANHFAYGESAGGYLWLTDARLLYVSHQANYQPHELSIPLAEIRDARPARTFGIVPNGLKVTTKSGAVEKFVVERRGEWVRRIQAARRTVPNGAKSSDHP